MRKEKMKLEENEILVRDDVFIFPRYEGDPPISSEASAGIVGTWLSLGKDFAECVAQRSRCRRFS